MADELDLSGEDGPGEPGKAKDAGKRSSSPAARSASPKGKASEGDLKKRIADGLGEVVEMLGGDSELGAAIAADANRMAEVLAAKAVKHETLARLLVRMVGKDSWLALARAFGPTSRVGLHRLREWREFRAEQAEYEQQSVDVVEVHPVRPPAPEA